MWWITLMAGSLAIAAGVVQIGRYFREVPGGGRDLAGSGPAQRLVAAAMYTAAGLFLSFFSLANLVAARLSAP